ncbi:hypothetical protein WR164_09930 [Philodulcilactobacillus myokoensis]|uniref:CSD domain-containing protein n=1 Tax=Philodulcilactobacillus myokoensis TaxID=2929573 RepID=A0A9W6B109_9LACO|nr:cold shock domain-containing protein [Philodulcilactobacillus myokoensis]GLB47014.1 hypothetical protein WR164_09930 [Philodulcilactobacillus myokoensis]
MLSGKIDSYDQYHGFGYIKGDNGEKLFFHVSGLLNHNDVPKVGKMVNFVVAYGARGPQAAKITLNNHNSL